MTYSDLYIKKPKKIPFLLGTLFVIMIVGFFIKVFSGSSLPSQASKKRVTRLEIANLALNQAAIFWQTDTRETGWIIYGEKENSLTNISIDERDMQNKKNAYVNHYAVLRNLKENTKIYFKIVSGNSLISGNQNAPFFFRTPARLENSQIVNPAYGKVIQNNGLPLANAAVIVSLKESFSLLSFTKASGEWLVPMNFILNKNDYRIKPLSAKEKITIEIISEDQIVSRIETNLGNVSPLPQTSIIGKNYDFYSDNVLSATTSLPTILDTIDVIYPKEDALIPGYKPIIKGIMLPDSEALLTVEADTITYTSKIKSDNKGSWSMPIKQNLPMGRRLLIMKTKNKDGEEVILKRNFVIIGNQGQDAKVLGATNDDPTLSGTPSPAPTDSGIVKPTPTQSVYATTAPTQTTETIVPSAPVSGTSDYISLIGASAFIILGLGILFIF
ncbi:MAG: hypothetical protein US11_C0001G0149 [Candidatus Roizmanbacteria bacterium GW2011_GWA2_36_23]|uniref:Bacterial Ig-like domain-containing protein n=1 Tax=Candidatus Roizmanbacteria bacterium GW2011_GWA2_36_23 TaxID=1618480 RepID=A0A0G0EM51_9BACT|nr:MAG: hypothetical protein US11_C0001G0149 [Candidatus Roizmanbacteria bacterium GW2011_GWA2_36_23]